MLNLQARPSAIITPLRYKYAMMILDAHLFFTSPHLKIIPLSPPLTTPSVRAQRVIDAIFQFPSVAHFGFSALPTRECSSLQQLTHSVQERVLERERKCNTAAAAGMPVRHATRHFRALSDQKHRSWARVNSRRQSTFRRTKNKEEAPERKGSIPLRPPGNFFSAAKIELKLLAIPMRDASPLFCVSCGKFDYSKSTLRCAVLQMAKLVVFLTCQKYACPEMMWKGDKINSEERFYWFDMFSRRPTFEDKAAFRAFIVKQKICSRCN